MMALRNCILIRSFVFRNLANYTVFLQSRITTSVTVSKDIQQQLPTSSHLQQELLKTKPKNTLYTRLLQVAVIGLPNAGKSTLINQLTGWGVCPASKKVHTTRKNATAIFVKGDSQIVFVDTPGLVNTNEMKKYKLEASFLNDPEIALSRADLFLVIHDSSNKRTCCCLSSQILRLLYLYPEKQSVLILNKIDLVKEKRLLLHLIQTLTHGFIDKQHELLCKSSEGNGEACGPAMNDITPQSRNYTETQITNVIQQKVSWPGFSKVFLVSGLTGDGISEIQDYLVMSARPSSWMYHSSVVTDQDPHDIAIAVLKAKLLDTFTEEIPYVIDISVEHWDINQAGMLNVVLKLDCHKTRISRIVVGRGGRCVAELARQTEQELRNIFHCDVCVKLDVTPFIATKRSFLRN